MSSSVIAPPKRLLYGPGPTMVAPSVYQAMSQPVVGHLDPYFFEVVNHVREGLREAFGTVNPMTLAVSGTGSAGMETAVGNFVEQGSRFGVFVSGYFGERLCDMGRRQGATVLRCEKPWGETFSEEEASGFIRREKPDTIAFVHAETSTGALQEPRAITRSAGETGALVIADCVTSFGAVPVNVDANGIDIAYSCTQKGLSCPPGLAPVTVSPRAMEKLRNRKEPVREWYLDLQLLEKYYDGKQYHHTASATLFYALAEGLRLAREEGLPRRFERHRGAHLQFVEGIGRLGLKMLVAEGRRIPNLNTPLLPSGASDTAIRQRLLDHHGMEVAGGFGPLAGKILRIGVMGPLATDDGVRQLLAALEDVLK